MPKTSSLKVQDLYKEYGGANPVPVLKGVDFEMRSGQAAAITGPSGCGKSTLLHLIGTLDSPTSGKIEIDGRDPGSFSEPDLARFRNQQIGFVFQDHHLLPQFTVLENVLIPTFAFKNGKDDAGTRAAVLLERVGLSERINHKPAELSGGERQRVAIARALINQPGILLCDEPTGNLDGQTAASVADLFFELHKEEQTILIVVTHNFDLAKRFELKFQLQEGRCVKV